MKAKKVWIFIPVLVLLLSSCSSTYNLYRVGNGWIPADNKYEAERRVASISMTSRHDRNSGAYVQKSTYLDRAFNVSLGTMRIVNKGLYVHVYQYDFALGSYVLDRKIRKDIYTDYTYWAQTRGRQQKVVIDVTRTAVFVRVFEGQRIVGRYTF